MKAMSIVAWALVVVLLIGAGVLAFLNTQQAGRVAGLRDALSQVATTAGVPDLTPEFLKGVAALPDVLQQVQAAIQAGQQELASTKETLAASQAEASGAKTEVATLKQGVEEQTAKAAAAAKELAAKEEALAAAKVEAEKAAEDLKSLEQQKADLAKNLEGAKAQWAEETSRLQAEVDAALQQVAALEAAAAPADVSDGEMPEEGEAADAVVAAPLTTLAQEQGEGELLGQSRMFSLIRYVEGERALYFRFLDGQTLTYHDVPMSVVDQLVGDPETVDMMYRFKIQGAYKSTPADSIVVRKYWKDQRRRPSKGDMRVSVARVPPPAKRESISAAEPLVVVSEEEGDAAEEAVPAAEAEEAPAAE